MTIHTALATVMAFGLPIWLLVEEVLRVSRGDRIRG